MASSILTGDRRWASTRKSGMTVLGKVPKPINLPSQRLENNGLDPNVEIVPKGTLTWGSRSSAAAPNAWSSSTLLSPKTDGGTGSPSHINGRPSSGGSGTRPSTAGSDRSHETASNAWGPNSRPSSASGLLAPNQTSIVATRPRSAETRPGSSQLSRFAENSAESTVAWGSTRIAERLGPPSSKTNGFMLSTGDFPTLGSEKNSESHSQRGHNSQRPGSASGTDAAPKERLESPLSGDSKVPECLEQGNMNTQKVDNYLYVGDGPPPNMNWPMEPQYRSLNMTPHQFDSWRGPPLHSPDGMWYRGGALGGPCRSTGPPGSFPADHFGYYPQFLPSSEAVPRQGAGQGGFHPNNGETCPHVPPNSFMVASHPVLPARPGVYQAPVPYDSYQGMPQAGFRSYSEREVPFLGVASRPAVYNQHPHQNDNLNRGQFQIRPGGHDPPMKTETDRAHGTHQGKYKVLLKQHDVLEDIKLQEMGQPVVCNTPHGDKGSKPGGSAQEASWCINSRKDEQAILGRSKPDCEGFSKPPSDLEGHSLESVIMDSQKNSDQATDGILMRPETAVSVAHDREGYPVTKKNATLMEKIEGLNNKARSADGHSEVASISFREEKTKVKAATRKADRSPKAIFSNIIPMENAPSSGMALPALGELNSSTINNDVKLSSDCKTAPGPSESQIIAVGKSGSSELGEVGHSHNCRRDNATRARADYHAKSRSNSQVDDGWATESHGTDSSVIITVTNGGNSPQGGVPDGHSSQEATAKESHQAINSASASYTSSLDSLDYQAQRAKMKEIAAQRAKQLQKEEEERTREQKAKALAKLEELNKRSSAQSSKQKSSDAIPTSIDMQYKQDSGADTVLKTDGMINEVPSVMLAENSDVMIQANDINPKNLHAPAELPSDIASHTLNNVTQDPAIYNDPFLALRQETNNTVVASQKMGSHIHDTSISKHKHMGYRRRQTISTEKNVGENAISSGNMESPKNLVETAVHASTSDSLRHNEDPSVHHKKKNTKNSRNKNKLDDATISSTTPSLAHTEEGIEKGPVDCQKTHPPALVVETVSVPAQNSSEISGTQGSRDVIVTSSKQEWSKATEEARARSSNQWKPQPPRRSARNQQGIKPGDKFHGGEAVIWAPVKQQNKNEQQPEEVCQSNMTDAGSQSLEKKEHDIQNGMKTKRAEMERYVPKPVAKEMSQQENSQQPSFVKQGASSYKFGKPEFDSRSLDSGGPDGLAVGKTEFLADTKNGEENKPNRRGRTHASWRQRNSAEFASAFQSSGEVSRSSAAKVVQNPSDSQLEKQFKSDDWDSNNDNAVPTEPVASLAGVKDEGITSRQKRQQFKVHRAAGNNHAPAGNKDLQTGIDDKSDIRTPAPDLNEPDLRNASKAENKNSGGEHMKSHWKPKSHANSHKQGNRSNGGQRVAFYSGRSDKEFTSKGFESNSLQEDTDAFIPNNGIGGSHKEAEGHMKVTVDPSKQQTNTPNKDVLITAELGPENVKAQNEHQVIPAARQHGQHSGHFIRGQEAAYRGRDSGQDAGRQNFQRHGDRRKNNSHYEYQPIGPYDKPSHSSQWNSYVGEESQEGSRAPRLRFRERDQNHSRQGGQFVRRSSGGAVPLGEP